MESPQTLISSHPFTEGMSPEHVALLSADASKAQFPAGKVIAKEGATAERFYLILSGQVAVEAHLQPHEELGVQTVGAGQALGWSWLFPPFQWHFTARVVEPVEAFEWKTERLRELGGAHPSFGYEMAKRITALLIRRLRATHAKLNDPPSAT